MTVILELRENLKRFYSKYDVFLVPLCKFLVALIVLLTVNHRLGYMTRIDNTAIVLIVSLMCSFLPAGAVLFFAAVFSLLHLYALSLIAAIVGVVVYLLIYLLYLRFAPREGIVVALAALLLAFRIPYVAPIVMGLVGTPASAVSIACGILAYYFLATVTGNATNLNALEDSETSEAVTQLRLIVDNLLGNRQMLVLIVAFGVTAIAVYIIRRLSIEHAWTIAILAGIVLDMVILLVGNLIYDAGFSFVSILLGSLLAAAVAKVIEFFRFCVDYSRTERVQFEDDEYYYYVKAVPKMSVRPPERRVKRINQRSGAGVGRSGSRRSAQEEYYEDDYIPDPDESYEDEYYEEEYYEEEEPDGGSSRRDRRR